MPPDAQAQPPQAQPEKKADTAALLIEIMKEQSLATMGLRKGLEDLKNAVLDADETLASLNTHLIGVSVSLERQMHVDDELLSIMVGDPKANPPVPGREPTMMDRLKIIQEYEDRLEREAAEVEKAEQKRREAEEIAVPTKPESKEKPIITSSPPSMTRPHHPLPVVRQPGASPST